MKTRQRIHRSSKIFTLTILLLFMGIQFATAQVVQLYPGDNNLQSTIDQAPAGTTFMFNPGNENEAYRLLNIEAKNGDSYIGVPDAAGNLPILKGSKVLTGFTQNGSYWQKNHDIDQMVTPLHGTCEPGFDCQRAEDVFIDGIPQKKVLTLAEMNENGECFIDGSQVYLPSNPSGKLVEISVKKFAIYAKRIDGVAASNVTVKNMIVEQYACPAQHGAIHAGYNSQFDQIEKMGKGWLIENNEVRYNHGAGIFVYTDGIARNNYVHHNGQIGMRSHGDNILIEENEIAENGNWGGFNWGWEGGGSKFTYSQDIRILNNYSHDNFGPGLWTDIENYNSYYEGNRVENNQGPGIFHEISYSATIKCNTLINNWNSNSGGNLYGGNIFISNASNVEVFDNICVSSGQPRENGIIINCAYRNKDGVTYYANNNYIHDNDIIFTADDNYSGALIQNDCTQASGNVFENNRYHSVNTAHEHFVWGPNNTSTGTLSWTQNINGQEQGSTIDGNLAIPNTPCDAISGGCQTPVVINAAGDEGLELMTLEINGENLKAWTVSTNFQDYNFTYSGTIQSLRVRLSNHDYVPGQIDYNLNVDYIIVDGNTIETNAPETYGKGVKLTDVAGYCNEGTDFTNEKLYCIGYFEYNIPTQNTACDDGDACTVNDTYDANCNCTGTFADADGDGVCDANDVCADGDDNIDANNNGIPDACDTPTCAPFTQFTVGTVTSQTIDLSWQQTDDDIQVLWRLESDVTSWQNAIPNTNTYTITDLNPDTEYRITLKNLCDNSTTSPQTVTTLAAANSTTYYYITNRATGDRFYPESTAHNAPLLKADAGRSDDWVQWEKIPTSGNFFYLKNKATSKFIRPKDDSDGVTVWQVPTTYTGSYTQWEEVPVNNSGYYFLKNRATGKHIRPQSDTPDAPIQQQPNTWTGSWTQWTIEPVNAPKLPTNNLTFNLYPNPADDYIRMEIEYIGENSSMSIYDISGKLVVHQAVTLDTFDVSVQNLKAGMYIARLDIGNGTYAAQRFVVQ